jgi:RNA polymerase sigma factor (sigma-70 family)
MPNPESTCWTVIRGAATGNPADRDEMARRYLSVVRDYLGARWRQSSLLSELEDAVQEIFIECFRRGGVLEAVESGRVTSFRAFLYGVIRNVARRFETRRPKLDPLPEEMDGLEESHSRLFDRTWARAIMAEAAQLQREQADDRGPDAVRRVELLRLRFEENLPIRTIAERWNIDAANVHHAYALARKEFRAALLQVVAFHSPGDSDELEQEAAGLLKALG